MNNYSINNLEELFNKIKILENSNETLLSSIQVYDCCSISLYKENEYLKEILVRNNIIF